MLYVFSLWKSFDQSCKCIFCCWFPYTRNKVANSRKRFSMARSQNTFTFCNCVCNCIFHMRDCFTQPDLLTSWKKGMKIKDGARKQNVFCVMLNLLFLLELLGWRRQRRIVKRRHRIWFVIFSIYIHQIHTCWWVSSSLPQSYSDSIFITYTCLRFVKTSHVHKIRRWLISNNRKQFAIAFPNRSFFAFALLIVANKT